MDDFARLFAASGLSLERLLTFLRVAEAGNLAKAAQGDVTKQSQFSRQIKELETFFGIQLTRRVGRRIAITAAGQHLATIIHRQFRELDDFRQTAAGRAISLRIGTQGSLIDWLLVPRLAQIRQSTGATLIELEPMRSSEVVRAVADGRLDFGIVRRDALPRAATHWPLGKFGYSLFAAATFWKSHSALNDIILHTPLAELSGNGQFCRAWRHWLATRTDSPVLHARAASLRDLVKIVRSGDCAAALPTLATAELPAPDFHQLPIPDLPPRSLTLITNQRSLERTGIHPNAISQLATTLALD